MSRVDRINGLSGSIAVKAPVKVATTANITLSGAQTIDSVALTADATPRQRVLVKDQTDTTENGIYDVNSGAWTRSPDFDGSRDAVNGTQVLVAEGTAPLGKAYYLSATNPVEIGTDALVFELAPNYGFGFLVLIETQTASSDATIDFTTGINSTYDEYELRILNAIPATDNVKAYLRTSSDTGANFDEGASDYRWAGRGQGTSDGAHGGGDADDIAIALATVYSIGSAANQLGVCANLKIVRPSEATYTRIYGDVLFTRSSTGYLVQFSIGGERVSAGVVDAIRFLFSSGDIESGIFKLYGVKKS